MVADKDILIDILLEAGSSARDPSDFEPCSQRIRGALLINSSTSPSACALADGIAYDGNASRQGLSVPGTGILLSDVIEGLEVLEIPEEVLEEEPDLTLEDLKAALMLTAHILRAFEYARKE